jgi:hypothetical protein
MNDNPDKSVEAWVKQKTQALVLAIDLSPDPLAPKNIRFIEELLHGAYDRGLQEGRRAMKAEVVELVRSVSDSWDAGYDEKTSQPALLNALLSRLNEIE